MTNLYWMTQVPGETSSENRFWSSSTLELVDDGSPSSSDLASGTASNAENNTRGDEVAAVKTLPSTLSGESEIICSAYFLRTESFDQAASLLIHFFILMVQRELTLKFKFQRVSYTGSFGFSCGRALPLHQSVT